MAHRTQFDNTTRNCAALSVVALVPNSTLPLRTHALASLCNHMVTFDTTVFSAIADPTRRGILDALRYDELSAGAIAEQFPVSRPAVSRHLRILRAAGLVRERKVAQSRLYSLDPNPLRSVDQWLSAYKIFWSARLHDLKRVAESQQSSSKRAP